MHAFVERAGPFPSVLIVTEQEAFGPTMLPSQFAPVSTTGLVGLAKRAWIFVRVSRRCTACVPTYPTSKTHCLPRARCTVRFHCCVFRATNLRGSAKPKRN